MHNVLRVFKRDLIRILKAPAAVVVIIVLITLPSLYTWLNVIGFWDPYDNTGNLRVCVVNEDAGALTDVTGQIDLGDDIVTSLHDDTQLGWTFTDRETALDEVESGEAYAAFIIPEDFSADFTTILSGTFTQPTLEYYVNEKVSAVSPKITDTGATTLDQTVNSTFVSTASSIIAETFDEELSANRAEAYAAQSDAISGIDHANSDIDTARSSIADLKTATDSSIGKADDARSRLERSKTDIDGLSDQLQQVSDLTATAQDKLGAYSSLLLSSMDQGSTAAAQAIARAETTVGKVSGVVSTASGDVEAAIANGQAAAQENETVIEQLKTARDSMPDGEQKDALSQIIADLETRNAELEDSLSDLKQLDEDTKTTASTIADGVATVDSQFQTVSSSTAAYRDTLTHTTLPAINSSLSAISTTSGQLAGAVASQKLLVDQTSTVVDQLISTLQTTSSALSQTDALLASVQDDLGTIRTDLVALDSADAATQLLGGGSLDAGTLADFMLSPTQISTESIYQLNAYGSSMAPLFTNLTLWIGVFMLMVILKLEVDDDGVEGLTIAQRYWARWLFLAPLVTLQAVVCCVGNLIIGVQTVNVPLYFLTAVIASLTYLSIQYALSTTLQHVGKGICVILVFAQIPGATGLYPIEMTPHFFQVVYPILPFTYGINAMRETIAGFYGNQWGQLIGILMLFMTAAFVIGLLVRPYLTNLNRLFSREIAETDILNGEESQVPARRFRLGQLIQALSDRDEYRERLERSAARFVRWYPRLKLGAWVFGIAVPTIAAVIFAVAGGERVVLLTLWLIWLLAVIMFLVLVEHARDSIERQSGLKDLDDDELRSLFGARTALGTNHDPENLDIVAGEMTVGESAYTAYTMEAYEDDAEPEDDEGAWSDDEDDTREFEPCVTDEADDEAPDVEDAWSDDEGTWSDDEGTWSDDEGTWSDDEDDTQPDDARGDDDR